MQLTSAASRTKIPFAKVIKVPANHNGLLGKFPPSGQQSYDVFPPLLLFLNGSLQGDHAVGEGNRARALVGQLTEFSRTAAISIQCLQQTVSSFDGAHVDWKA